MNKTTMHLKLRPKLLIYKTVEKDGLQPIGGPNSFWILRMKLKEMEVQNQRYLYTTKREIHSISSATTKSIFRIKVVTTNWESPDSHNGRNLNTIGHQSSLDLLSTRVGILFVIWRKKTSKKSRRRELSPFLILELVTFARSQWFLLNLRTRNPIIKAWSSAKVLQTAWELDAKLTLRLIRLMLFTTSSFTLLWSPTSKSSNTAPIKTERSWIMFQSSTFPMDDCRSQSRRVTDINIEMLPKSTSRWLNSRGRKVRSNVNKSLWMSKPLNDEI